MAWEWAPPSWSVPLGAAPPTPPVTDELGGAWPPPEWQVPAAPGAPPAGAAPLGGFSPEEAGALAATGGAVPGAPPSLPAGAFTADEAAALAATGGAAPVAGAPIDFAPAAPSELSTIFPSAAAVDAAAAQRPGTQPAVVAAPLPGAPPADAAPGLSPPVAAGAVPGAAPGQVSAEEAAALGAGGTPDVRAEALRLASLTPEQFLLEKNRREETARNNIEAKAHAASVQNLKDAADNAEAHRKAVVRAGEQAAQLQLDAKAAASLKVDTNKWYDDLSTGQKIGAWVAMVVGGLAAASNGGPNVGLDIVLKKIDQSIDAQKANIQNARSGIAERRGIVADMYQQSGDEHRAAEAARIASYEQVVQGLTTELNNYDPKGTTAMRLAEQIRQIRARQAAAAASYLDDEQKRQAEEEKRQLELRKQAEIERSNRADEGIRYQGVKLDEKRVGIEEKKLDAEREKTQFERAKEEREDGRKYGIGGPGEAVKHADGSIEVTAGQPLLNADGKPFKARKEETAAKLAQQLTATGEVVDIIDEILAIRDRVGGESSAFNSDESQQLEVLKNRLIILEKSGTEGMSSDEDMKKIAAAAGAKDPASFRKQTAGLEKGRERTLSTFNRSLRSNQYTGKPYDPPNRFKGAPDKTAEEKKLQSLVQKPDITIDEAERQATALAVSAVRNEKATIDQPNYGLGGSVSEDDGKRVVEESKKIAADYKNITPVQRDEIRQLGVRATAGDAKAKADLEFIVSEGQTPKIREFAQDTLDAAKPVTAGPPNPARADIEQSLQASLNISVPKGDGAAAKQRVEAVLKTIEKVPPEQRDALLARLRKQAKGDKLAEDFQHALSTASRERAFALLGRI